MIRKSILILLAISIISWEGFSQQPGRGIGDLTSVVNAYPDWSPDGTKIAFQSDRNSEYYQIYTMNADGTNLKQLTQGNYVNKKPNWSPDGSKLIFISERDGNEEVYMMNPDGTDQTNLTNHPGKDEYPFWHPNGKEILFTSFRDNQSMKGSLLTKNSELYRLNIENGELKRLTDAPSWDIYGSPSPNGKQLLYYRKEGRGNTYAYEVYIADADGKNRTNISNNRLADDYFPSWSPDGEWIVFSSNRDYPLRGEYHRYDDHNFDLYICKPDGSNLRRITHSPGFGDARAKWSPDGTKIAFTRAASGEDAMSIEVIDVSHLKSTVEMGKKQYLNFAFRPTNAASEALYYRTFEQHTKDISKIYQVDYYMDGTKRREVSLFAAIPNSFNGKATYWFKNGQVDAEGEYLNHVKNGEWKYYNKGGQIVARRIYSKGTIVHSQFWNDSGKEIFPKEEEIHHPASFGQKGGIRSYMIKNLRYPPSLLKSKIEGRVPVMFEVNEAGKIENLRVMRSLHPELDKEAVRLIKSMPNWIPAMNHNRKQGFITGLNVTFRVPTKSKA